MEKRDRRMERERDRREIVIKTVFNREQSSRGSRNYFGGDDNLTKISKRSKVHVK